MTPKPIHFMLERDGDSKLPKFIKVVDTYISGEHTWHKRDPGAVTKVPIITAAETTRDNHSARIRLLVVKYIKTQRIMRWSLKCTHKNTIIPDDLVRYYILSFTEHEPGRIGRCDSRSSTKYLESYFANFVLENTYNVILRSYRAVGFNYIQKYFLELYYLSNHLYYISIMNKRLTCSSLIISQASEIMLKKKLEMINRPISICL